jgi:HK97 family phage major capsid protein
VPARLQGTTPARATGTILGVPYAETTQIPVTLTQGTSTDCSDVFVGQWDEALVLERGGIEIATSDQILFQNYQTAIRAIVRRDFVVRHGIAFAVAIGVRP